ncbi:MAG: Adenosylmethionine-8-amino-7-oxononanoate aminotransferase [Chlamydiae bacterium]|nr:Adenosylmethionine-8-amino-7-oxononanoate aminotransferase [Chlamydiota bacterium]
MNTHGHCHPYIAEKMAEAMHQLDQVLFADFTHAYSTQLANRLLECSGSHFDKVFFSDSGSTAVETALKIALRKGGKKKKILSLKGGYYGDTFGAMSLAGTNYFNRPYAPYFFDTIQISEGVGQLKSEIEEAICFVYEPLLQGAVSGMRLYSADGLNEMLSLCRQHGVITIADEVMTGFGRCGPLFASELMETKPDMLCLAKALSGGTLPIGATLVRKELYGAFLSDDLSEALLHGSSYAGNPITAASALANLELLEQDACSRAREAIGQAHKEFCVKWRGHPHFKRLESIGTILIAEYATDHPEFYSDPIRERLNEHFFSEGIAIRPFGRVLYIAPPYCINHEDLIWIYKTIESSLNFSIR